MRKLFLFIKFICCTFAPAKNKMMKYTLFIMFLAIATPIFSQEAVNDTLQELPKTGIKADRRAQLERAISKLWELDRED